jgi:hypothetical protein
MSTLLVDGINDADGGGPKATLPTSGGSAFTLGPNWGALEFVSDTAISAVTNIDVQSLAAGYDYLFSIMAGVPATDNVNLEIRVFQSTTINTGSNYADQASAATSSITVMQNVGNVSSEGISAEFLLTDPGDNTGDNKWVLATDAYAFTDGTINSATRAGGLFHANTTAIDGIRFFWSSGNWQAVGQIRTFRRRLS